MAGHTPGPWEIVTANGRLPIVRTFPNPHGEAPSYGTTLHAKDMALVCRLDFGYGQPTDKANALLIAAAPDLLAACKAALDWYGLDGDHITEPVRSQLLAAIAKADGSALADPGATGGV